MNARVIVAGVFGAGVVILAAAAWRIAGVMVATWSPTLTVVVVTFGGAAVVILAHGVGAGVRLALGDKHEHARPVVVASAHPAGFLPDPLRDAERLARIEGTYARISRDGTPTVPAFEPGRYTEDVLTPVNGRGG